MTTIALPGEGQGSRYRVLGWGASALLHGGALAFFLYGLPHSTMPAPAPEIIPLEMAAAPVAPQMEASASRPAMEEAQAVAPQPTTAAQVPPPPLAMTAPEAATVSEPPPEAVTATPPEAVAPPPPIEAAPTPPMETLQAVEPKPQRPPEPDVVPLEAVDIPPPPPAPPPPPVQPRPPPPPRPAPPRREPMREAPTTAPVEAQPMARQAPQGATTAAPPPSQPSAAAESRAAAGPPVNYASAVFAALKRATRYPQRARLRRIEGVATVNIAMRRDGTVTSWTIVRSTGNDDLDQAAGEAIERASPLPAPPPNIPGDPVHLQMPISFTLR